MTSKTRKLIIAATSVIALFATTAFTYDHETNIAKKKTAMIQYEFPKIQHEEPKENFVIQEPNTGQVHQYQEEPANHSEIVVHNEELFVQTGYVSANNAIEAITLEITAYSADGGDPNCPGAIMANGEEVHVGAAALNGVPFGTRVYIPEFDRVVTIKDRCGYDGVLDIYCNTTSECYDIGRRTATVHILND